MKRSVSPQEQAAQEHYATRGSPDGPWAELHPETRALEIIAFQCALKVIRQPNKPMLRAAAKAMSPDRRPTPKRVSVAAKHGIRFRAMIDVLLEPAVMSSEELPLIPSEASTAALATDESILRSTSEGGGK